MCYIHLACRAAKQRRVHSCKRKRRSANSVAASLPRRSVAAPTVSQRGSRVAASQRRSANSVAASQRQQRRSVTPAASQRQQRRSVTGPTAASQRRSVTASPAPGSVAASQRRSATRLQSVEASQRRSATRLRERHSATSETHVLAPFAPALGFQGRGDQRDHSGRRGAEIKSSQAPQFHQLGASFARHAPGMEVKADDESEASENAAEEAIRKREEDRQEELQLAMEQFPLWARPLKIGCKQVPELGLINVDPDQHRQHHDEYHLEELP